MGPSQVIACVAGLLPLAIVGLMWALGTPAHVMISATIVVTGAVSLWHRDVVANIGLVSLGGGLDFMRVKLAEAFRTRSTRDP